MRDALRAGLRREQLARGHVGEAVGLVRLLAEDRDAPGHIEPVDAARAQIGEEEAAVRHRQRTFGEDETFLHELDPETGSDDVGHALVGGRVFIDDVAQGPAGRRIGAAGDERYYNHSGQPAHLQCPWP